MTVIVDLLVLILLAASIVISSGFSLLDFLMEYLQWVHIAAAALLALKYCVYMVQMFQNIRFEESHEETAGKKRYLILVVYPVCDLLRLAVAAGLLSAILNQLVEIYPVFDGFIDHIVYTAFIVIALFLDYFCKNSDTIKANLISTAIFLAAALVYSRHIIMPGLQALAG